MYNELVVTDNLSQYMASVGKIPMMTDEEIKELGYRVLHNNDLDAARKMVLAHLRFVVFIAKKYVNYDIPLEDLIQEGNIGLMKAVHKFDPDKGVKLTSFAVHWIRAAIHEYVISNWKSVKIATTKPQRKLFFNLRKMKNQIGYLTEEERKSMAEALDVNIKDVRIMEERIYSSYLSYDATDNDDNGNAKTFVLAPSEFLYDEGADPAQQVEDEEYQAFVKSKVMNFIDNLSDRDRDIVLSRKFMDPPLTMKVLSERYNISIQRIEQLEKRYVKKLMELVEEL